MTSSSNTIVGYVTPRPFGQFNMPVPAQNSCLREYATSRGFSYVLPQCEHIFMECYVQWFGTLNGVRANQDIVIYSRLMLPSRRHDQDQMIRIIEEKKLRVHTVLENLLIQGGGGLTRIREITKILRITQQELSFELRQG
jgi:sporadic carbohydrate cluster protein (TIGR04323 family)